MDKFSIAVVVVGVVLPILVAWANKCESKRKQQEAEFERCRQLQLAEDRKRLEIVDRELMEKLVYGFMNLTCNVAGAILDSAEREQRMRKPQKLSSSASLHETQQ